MIETADRLELSGNPESEGVKRYAFFLPTAMFTLGIFAVLGMLRHSIVTGELIGKPFHEMLFPLFMAGIFLCVFTGLSIRSLYTLLIFFGSETMILDADGVVLQKSNIFSRKKQVVPLHELREIRAFSHSAYHGIELRTTGKSIRCFQRQGGGPDLDFHVRKFQSRFRELRKSRPERNHSAHSA